MNAPLLVAEHLTFTAADGDLGRRDLFRDFDLAVGRQDLVEVRGPNGSGKSTLLRCLAGLVKPAAGRVERHAGIEYLGHRSGLSGRLTPLENARWVARLRGHRPAASVLDAAMARVGLGGARDDPCATLSAGQQRRAALARLLVCAADVWLLDEPLTALDDVGAALVRELIAQHRAAGGAAVCATHRELRPPATTALGSLPAIQVVSLGG